MSTNYLCSLLFMLTIGLISCKSNTAEFWLLDCELPENEVCGFKNSAGEIKIEYGKYQLIFTDTFRNYAIVLKGKEGFVGIDKEENVLFHIFNYDNGPDYVVEGLFRIVKHNKIGYVNAQTGQIEIKPTFSAARPFENGYAAVCLNCETKKDGEHSILINGKWGLIDKKGTIIVAPQYDRINSIGSDKSVTVLENGIEKTIDLKNIQ